MPVHSASTDVGVSMFRRINMVRKAVALCLAVVLLCQTVQAGQCVCSKSPTKCSTSCACRGNLSGHHDTVVCAECSASCCTASRDKSSIPSQPCKCQCHPAPFGAIPPPADGTPELIELLQVAVVYAPYEAVMHTPSSLRQLRFARATDSWSPLDTCVLFCRFLA
ncbi:hypothetical protein HG15A2_03220 [Adhaeretor mobilis]|uniref:Uncharacterized protein n=1 Tax=Adhaeretor mobilis TaxID=1930276 RepID=A0A517MQ97_9BACT|nr:hypothetical protein HG15A2_03220 [Adhaeretor mobilis]